MKTLQIDYERFKREIEKAKFSDRGEYQVNVADVYAIIDRLQCRNEWCNNECRYDSGFCSLCDMRFNDSKGKRITHPELPQPAECRVCDEKEEVIGEFKKWGGHCFMCLSQG